MTESPFDTQGWNRYTYVGNSPVNFTDPSGYCFLGCFWNKILKAVAKVTQKVPILGTIIKIAATVMCGGNPVCGIIAGGLTSALVTGLSGGKLGQALKAGLITMATAVAFNVVGTVTLGPAHATPAFGSVKHLYNVAGHAGVGCLSSVASGGKCGQGRRLRRRRRGRSAADRRIVPEPKDRRR